MSTLPLAPYRLSTCHMLVVRDMDPGRTTTALIAGLRALVDLAEGGPLAPTPAEAEQRIRALAVDAVAGGRVPVDPR